MFGLSFTYQSCLLILLDRLQSRADPDESHEDQ